ncbi:chaperone modulator CbpM [Spongiibacter nanhainus]|uniref:chaperone modulator CbpM n=1 Tax=Spongiibacter nanhainus TaxID=2794344 RepID=UPI001E3E643E|nr:chaperone modulator CbpM [Spongiibacter nanhainus]
MSERVTQISFEQFCTLTDLSGELVIEIVNLGIVEPPGQRPQEWLFDSEMLCLVRRAERLHRQLEINWPGVALAMDLLDQLERSREENRVLRSQLQRLVELD